MTSLNEVIRALLRGEALPQKLEELREPLLTVLDDLAAELTGLVSDTPDPLMRERLLGDGSQTVAIMGQRGSGKSTLLAAVTAELIRQRRHLVVPIMRPDQFGEPDSVITTFLAELWDLLCAEGAEEDGSASADNGEAIKLLADVARGSAMARTTTAALEQGTEGPNDFADDYLAVSRSGVRLALQLRQLATHLCAPNGDRDSARLIIVPIDDPDLAPHDIVEILTDLQILSSVPGIVPVTCFSPEDLYETWLNSRHRHLPEATSKHLRFLLARQMEKVFPYRYRFEIEPIVPSQRATFTPIAGNTSLNEKLAVLRSDVERVTGTCWPFDETVTNGQEPFGVANPLPDNARTLVQLWETLDAIDREDTASDALLHLTLRRVVDVLAEGVATKRGLSQAQLVHIGSPLRDDEPRRKAEINFSGVRFLPAISSKGQKVGDSSLAVFTLHQVRELRVAERPEESPIPGEYKKEDLIPGEESAALFALQEILCGTGFFQVSGNRLVMSTSDWRFMQTVVLANQETDDVFVLLPDATTLSEMLRSATLWNELVSLTERMSTESLLATTIEAACLTLEPGAKLKHVDDYEEAFERAGTRYLEALGRGGSTSRAFVQWFERDLPLQWHSAFFGGERIRSFAARHRELREQPARLEYPEIIDATLFEARLRHLLDSQDAADPSEEAARHSWVAGYFELASALESGELARLSALYPRWQRDSAGVRAGAATAGSVTAAENPRFVAAPYPTAEGSALLAAGLAALRRAKRAAQAELFRH